MTELKLTLAAPGALDVREFSVREGISELFDVVVTFVTPEHHLDFDAIVGEPAAFEISAGYAFLREGGRRRWGGVCASIDQIGTAVSGLATYQVHLVPFLWLLTHRRGNRVYQRKTIPEILSGLLNEWNLAAQWVIDPTKHAPYEYKIQYNESDFAFFSRLLEDAGISYTFVDGAQESTLLLSDTPEKGEARAPIHYEEHETLNPSREFVARLRVGQEVRPGRYTARDYDFRGRPDFNLIDEAKGNHPPEVPLEHYRYEPGAFTDDKAKRPAAAAAAHARLRLEGLRSGNRRIHYDTNVLELTPGRLFAIDNHPREDLQSSTLLMATTLHIEGQPDTEWKLTGEAVFASRPFRPALIAAKPRIYGVQSALVVGPAGQEIHTDEYGRVSVQFHWDREGKRDEGSSCWIRVSQGWAGASYGSMMIPRVGHEVLVAFLDGDPDEPIIVGRVHNSNTVVPYKLPQFKTVSTWRSQSSPKSAGFNELMFQDAAGNELVYLQAERDLQRRYKGNEVAYTGGARYSVIQGSDSEHTQGAHHHYVGATQDLVVRGNKRELTASNQHLVVKGDYAVHVNGTDSRTVDKDHHEKTGANHALEAGEEIHIKAGTKLILEAGAQLTIKAAGAFIDIGPAGVSISGKMVYINSGGDPATGSGAHPAVAQEAESAPSDDRVTWNR
jgi:type VI secretion system secreted protein VgrG